ncbi:MAG: tetratricopeptide repeat protein [Arenicellales bacterium]|jgi:Flp pilus assembly protein TadD
MRFALKRPVRARTPGSLQNLRQQTRRWLPALIAIAAGGTLPGTAVPASEFEQIQALLNSQRYDEALALITTTITKTTDSPTELLFARADVLASSGRHQEAEQAYRELITRYPGRPEPYNNLARLYSLQGKLEQAAALLRAGLYTDPSYRVLFDNLSQVYAEQAARAYRHAMNPEDSQANKKEPLTTLGELSSARLPIATP